MSKVITAALRKIRKCYDLHFKNDLVMVLIHHGEILDKCQRRRWQAQNLSSFGLKSRVDIDCTVPAVLNNG